MKYILLFGLIVQFVDGGTVFTTDPDIEHPGSGATLIYDHQVELVDFTLCWRFYELQNPYTKYFISSIYKDEDDKESYIFALYSRWRGEEYEIGFNLLGYWVLVMGSWPAMEWNHVCFSYTNSTSIARIVSNGQVIHNEVIEGLKQNPEEIPAEFLGNFAIMRRYFRKGYYFDSMAGKMTDVNIWNNLMTTQDMVSWTNCSFNKSGNVVKWRADNWITTGLKNEEINWESLCQKDIVTMKVFVHKANYKDSLDFCTILGTIHK